MLGASKVRSSYFQMFMQIYKVHGHTKFIKAPPSAGIIIVRKRAIKMYEDFNEDRMKNDINVIKN